MKELEDYAWFPAILRKFQVEFIGDVVRRFGLYKPLVAVIETICNTQQCYTIVDLCSGSGAPSIYIFEKMQKRLPIVLTDKYPQQVALPKGMHYQANDVDVLTMPFKTHTLYTMYNAFHHFTTEEQQAILQKAKEAKASLLIIEVLTPTIFTLVNVLISSIVVQLIVTPFIKPFSWLRLLFTYIIPINLLTVTIDGVISVLKSKTKKQYEQLTANNQPHYSVITSSIQHLGNTIIYITAQTNL